MTTWKEPRRDRPPCIPPWEGQPASRAQYLPALALGVVVLGVLVTAAPWLKGHHAQAVTVAREVLAVLLVVTAWAVAGLTAYLCSPSRWVRRPRWPEGPDLAPLDVPERPRPRPAVHDTASPALSPAVAYPRREPEPVPEPVPEPEMEAAE